MLEFHRTCFEQGPPADHIAIQPMDSPLVVLRSMLGPANSREPVLYPVGEQPLRCAAIASALGAHGIIPCFLFRCLLTGAFHIWVRPSFAR
jgi:hypothetical protein